MTSERISKWLIAARWPLLAVGVALTIAAVPFARSLDFDRSVENMFADDDPLLVPYRQLKRTFGGNEIVLAVYDDPALLAADSSGIDKLEKLGQRLKQVPGVREVLSLANLDQAVQSLTMFGGSARIFEDHPLANSFLELFEGYTHGSDRRTAAVICMLIPSGETDVPRRQTIDGLRAIIAEYEDGKLTGEPAMVVDGFRYIEEDGQRLGWATTVLLSLTVILCFRSLRWVVIPVAIVQSALLLTQATLVLSGLRLSMVSSMLTAIVTVIGVATVIHVIVRFREARSDGLPPREALLRTGTLLVAPVGWACTTDAVGFAALSIAKVGPVQDFGLMMAVGSLMVLFSAGLLLPGLVLLGRFDTDPHEAWGERRLESALHWLAGTIEKRPLLLAVGALVCFAAAAFGITRLRIETDFTKNFRSDSSIVQAYELVETRLGGAGILDIILPAPAVVNAEYLANVERLQERLRSEIDLGKGSERPDLKVLSMADAIDAGSGAMSPLMPASMKIPVVTAGMKQQIPAFMAALHGKDPETGEFAFRIMLRAHERQPAEQKQRLIAQIERISREEFPQAEVTGFFVLLTNLVDSILRDQWLTFGVALAGIGLTMLLAFRSLLDAVIALIPNAFPIFMVTGLMGWLEFKINMGAAMIAAVSMGLSIDSSIHYITSYRRALQSGLSSRLALEQVQSRVGRAMIFSTLALLVGFTVLCISQFIPTVYFGALVSLTMFGGMAGNLIVLPLLLQFTARLRTQPHKPQAD